MLAIKNLNWQKTNGQKIIDRLSLSVPDNQILVITGANGSGKTSLVKLIVGLAKPTDGKIIFQTKDISKLSVDARAKLGINYAWQQPVRFKGLTVHDLFSLVKPIGVEQQVYHQVLTAVGLEPAKYLDQEWGKQFSGGEIKRLELALTLIKPAQLYLFDEPEAGIDLWSFQQLVTIFRQLKKTTQASIIIVSHQERILSLADRIVVMADGQIVQDGSKAAIFPQLMDRAGAKKRTKLGEKSP